jgi:hypothetical protein
LAPHTPSSRDLVNPAPTPTALALGGNHVVALLGVEGPIVSVDRGTTTIVGTYSPPAGLLIDEVVTTAERVYFVAHDFKKVALYTLPPGTLAGPARAKFARRARAARW